jgi:poly(3-hydroxybutyrate) depolymerase
MSAGSRILATIIAGIVWIFAGLSVASGPLATQAITPAVLDVAASCTMNLGP